MDPDGNLYDLEGNLVGQAASDAEGDEEEQEEQETHAGKGPDLNNAKGEDAPPKHRDGRTNPSLPTASPEHAVSNRRQPGRSHSP